MTNFVNSVSQLAQIIPNPSQDLVKSAAQIIYDECRAKDKKFPYGKALEVAAKIFGKENFNQVEAVSSSEVVVQRSPRFQLVEDWGRSGVITSMFGTYEEALASFMDNLGVPYEWIAGELVYDEARFDEKYEHEISNGDLYHFDITEV